MKKPLIKTDNKGYWTVDYQRPYKRLSMEERAVVHSYYNLVQSLNCKDVYKKMRHIMGQKEKELAIKIMKVIEINSFKVVETLIDNFVFESKCKGVYASRLQSIQNLLEKLKSKNSLTAGYIETISFENFQKPFCSGKIPKLFVYDELLKQ